VDDRTKIGFNEASENKNSFKLNGSQYDICMSSCFGTELPTSHEIHCIQALCDLRAGNIQKTPSILNRSKQTDSEKYCDSFVEVRHAIVESELVGTKINVFLFSFVKRTGGAMECLVDLSLIQKAVGMLSFFQRSDQNMSWGCGYSDSDPACWTYFLAAIRLGSLQSDDFEVELQKRYYQTMESSFKSCYGEERREVILAHLLVAFFCFSTSQTSAFVKHCGFAKALLDSLNFNVPDQTRNSYFVVAHGIRQLLIPPSILESGLLRLFLSYFSINPLDFSNGYPLFSAFMNSSFEITFNSTEAVDADFRPCLLAIFQGSPPVATLLMTVRFFQKALVSLNLPKHQTVDAVAEISKLFTALLSTMKCSLDSIVPTVKSYILQVECFKCLLTKDLQGAKCFLRAIFDSMDFWMLRMGYLTFGEVLVHQLNLLIAAAFVLDMEIEYHLFWKKVNFTWSLMQRVLCISEFLHEVPKCNPCSLCNCNEPTPECSIPFSVLASLCIAGRSDTPTPEK